MQQQVLLVVQAHLVVQVRQLLQDLVVPQVSQVVKFIT
jgi:hypothetical protein